MTSKTICRWGVLGTASIARKNWHALLNAGNSRIIAVASRSREKAQRFIDECQHSVPTGYPVEAIEGYDNLIARKDIDAVYIPLPTIVRSQWAIKAALAGKHIVIEKPCGLDANELANVLAAAHQTQVQVMDGVMFQHSSRLAAMHRLLADQHSVGTVRRITSHFSFMASPDWMLHNSMAEPAGCLGDVGWYNIRLTLCVLNGQMPLKVRGRMLNGIARSDGSGFTPIEFEGELVFENGVTATMYNAFNTSRQQWAYISGTEGYLHVKDFVLPHYGNDTGFTLGKDSFSGEGCFFNLERHEHRFSCAEYSNNHPTSQETQLFRTFGNIVLSGTRCPTWPELSLKTQRIMDALLLSAQSDGCDIQLT